MIKKFRILILLYVLLIVALSDWLTKERSTDWDSTLVVAIYPINGDGTEITAKYIDALEKDTFASIEDFFNREAKNYQLTVKKPFKATLAKPISAMPPIPPEQSGSVLSIMIWSLKLRYWSWRIDNYDRPKNIQVFVIYFDPKNNQRLAHSLGLQKGMIGVVNAFADKKMSEDNNVIIAHEILHTVGGTDKYDPKTNLPLFPIGFAEPNKTPSFPQKKAEIMAGRIPITVNETKAPSNLKQVVIGNATATEIKWTGRTNES